jgi:hypothetical protein
MVKFFNMAKVFASSVKLVDWETFACWPVAYSNISLPNNREPYASICKMNIAQQRELCPRFISLAWPVKHLFSQANTLMAYLPESSRGWNISEAQWPIYGCAYPMIHRKRVGRLLTTYF